MHKINDNFCNFSCLSTYNKNTKIVIMNDGYWIIIGLVTFIVVVFKILQLSAQGFFDRFKKKI